MWAYAPAPWVVPVVAPLWVDYGVGLPLYAPVSFLQVSAGGDGSAVAGADPYGFYYAHDTWGRLVTSPNGITPHHTHRWQAEMDGRTAEERQSNFAYITGAPPGVAGANYVQPCPTFPYCNYIPPPLPLVPAPYRLSAPLPTPTFPVLGMPPRMPWHPKAKGLGLASGPLRPSEPENLLHSASPMGPKDEAVWKQSLEQANAQAQPQAKP